MSMQSVLLGGFVDEEVGKINANFAEIEADYAKETDIPTVPQNVSGFTNDAGYQTAAQVTAAVTAGVAGLEIPADTGDLTNTAGYVKSTDAAFINKVDKENGKGLSSNDFTDDAEAKVARLGKIDLATSDFVLNSTDNLYYATKSAAGKYPVTVMRANGSDFEEVLAHTKVSGNNIIIVSSQAFAGYVVTI